MKRLVCVLVGHRWRLMPWRHMGLAYRRCSRCGRATLAHGLYETRERVGL